MSTHIIQLSRVSASALGKRELELCSWKRGNIPSLVNMRRNQFVVIDKDET